jgi:hypothetical protein
MAGVIETVDIPVRDIVPSIKVNVRVTGTRGFLFRTRLGLWLLKVGAVVASVVGKLDIHIEV